MLVDIATVYYRAYFSMPDSLKSPDGRQINAVRGTFDALLHFLDTYQPQHFVTAWDLDWRPEWRVELIDSYKTARVAGEDEEQMPDTLSDQVDLVRTALTELGVDCVGVEGYEADDVIAQYARIATSPTYVVSGDRDLFQLIDDERDVSVLYLGTGVTKHTHARGAYIKERFGIEASQYGHFSIMRGDASDGLPGVKGVGEKTAAALLAQFGDLPGILAAAKASHEGIKPRIAASLLEHEDYLGRALEVVMLHRDIEVPSPSSQWRSAADSQTLRELGMTRYIDGWNNVLDY
jgi:5'-3' exonuclease